MTQEGVPKMDETKLSLQSFASDTDEAEFWESHSTAPYWGDTDVVEVEVAPNPRRTKMISLRLDEQYLGAVKAVAARKGIPYQTLMRLWLVERLRAEGALPPE